MASDTLDPSGYQAGLIVELRAIQPGGGLGSAQAVATTDANGRFSMAMPAGRSSADGTWMLTTQAGATPLRAYLHPGQVRVDVSSEAWVRQVAAASGQVVAFPGSALDTAREIAQSVALVADATGEQRAGMTADQAVNHIAESLSRDHAMSHIASSLQAARELPANGTGDIGSFFGLSANPYAAMFLDAQGQPRMVTVSSQISGDTMSADGTWSYRAVVSSPVNGQWTPIVGEGGNGRLTPSRMIEHLGGDAVETVMLANAIGEYPSQSFPLRSGARQLDARRITSTGLNFTGGTDEQPLAFSTLETVGGVETVALPSGSHRALKVTNDLQIVFPKTTTAVTTLLLRTTLWLAPGVGIVKEVNQTFVDGVADASAPAATLELIEAYANAAVWPAQVTFRPNRITGALGPCKPVPLPSLRRFVTVESGAPVVNGLARLALKLWDMDTGLPVGPMRTFSGNWKRCPVADGSGTSLLVAETFSERNLLSTWPSDAATAKAQSDVVHHVSGGDLSDLVSHRLAAVPDAATPSLYWPAEVGALFPAPDGSGRFIVGTVRTDYLGVIGSAPQHAQVLGPGLASPIVNTGIVLLIGADWANGRLYSSESSGTFTIRQLAFSPLGGVDMATARVVRSGEFVHTLWYASANLLHLNTGHTIRIADGTNGPLLPYTADVCGFGSGVLVCLDSANDRLVKFDPDNLALLAMAPLGSLLRAQSQSEPDFRGAIGSLGGIPIMDESTFTILGHDVHVGRWP